MGGYEIIYLHYNFIYISIISSSPVAQRLCDAGRHASAVREPKCFVLRAPSIRRALCQDRLLLQVYPDAQQNPSNSNNLLSLSPISQTSNAPLKYLIIWILILSYLTQYLAYHTSQWKVDSTYIAVSIGIIGPIVIWTRFLNSISLTAQSSQIQIFISAFFINIIIKISLK